MQLSRCYTTTDQCGNIIVSDIIETSKYITSRIKLQKINQLILKNFNPGKFQAIQYQNSIILSFKANSYTSLSCQLKGINLHLPVYLISPNYIWSRISHLILLYQVILSIKEKLHQQLTCSSLLKLCETFALLSAFPLVGQLAFVCG